jgi:hypothetical protein
MPVIFYSIRIAFTPFLSLARGDGRLAAGKTRPDRITASDE